MNIRIVCLTPAVMLMISAVLQAQTDPGPRPGPPAARNPLPGVLRRRNSPVFRKARGGPPRVVSVRNPTQAPDHGRASL